LEKSVVGADLSEFVSELVGGPGLEDLSVGSKGCLGSLLNLGLLGNVHFNVVLGVLGASEGSDTSFLLLHVKLLLTNKNNRIPVKNLFRGDALRLLCRNICRKIFAHVDWGLNRGSRVCRPVSEDPHRRERNFW
jgi:hypothetical protein